MGEAIAGTHKPLVVTSGTGLLAPGRLATEDDSPPSGDVPRTSEPAAFAFVQRGVRVSAVRLPQVHGGDGKCGFIGYAFEITRQRGVSAYVGDGANRWPSAHRLDAARLYRLALEKGRSGAAYHAVADEGIPFKAIASVIGGVLGLPVEPRPAEHFGWFAAFAGGDMAASSARTRILTGWNPTGPDLLSDIGQSSYYRR